MVSISSLRDSMYPCLSLCFLQWLTLSTCWQGGTVLTKTYQRQTPVDRTECCCQRLVPSPSLGRPKMHRFWDWKYTHSHTWISNKKSLLFKSFSTFWSILSPGISGPCSSRTPQREIWAFPECSAGKHRRELTSTQRGHCAARRSLQRLSYHEH